MEVLQAIEHFGTNHRVFLLFIVLVELIEPGVGEAFGCGRAILGLRIKHLLKQAL